MKESGEGSAADSRTGSAVPASAAAGYLLNHLIEISSVTGYNPPRTLRIQEILDEHGVAGHSIMLPAPRNGFTQEQREAIENYSTTLTYWHHLLVEVDWIDKGVKVIFRRADEPEEEQKEKEKKLTLREKLRGPAYRAVRTMGQILVEQGFMVREPVEVCMVTLESRFNGWAIMVKYPGTPKDDKAGIMTAYDKWVPLLADAFARSEEVKSETVKDGIISTVFFTKDKRYVASMYDTSKMLRMFAPKKSLISDPVFFTKSTFRACRALAIRYKKDFIISKRPMAAWGAQGHSILMTYKKGAAGKLVDESYMYNVRLMTEKVMKKFHLQASIKHYAESRSLIVTFYNASFDKWSSLNRGFEGLAVVNYDESNATTVA
jgi:hypothetical protein